MQREVSPWLLSAYDVCMYIPLPGFLQLDYLFIFPRALEPSRSAAVRDVPRGAAGAGVGDGRASDPGVRSHRHLGHEGTVPRPGLAVHALLC